MSRRLKQWFITPTLDGPISGGTLYNRGLLTALSQQGIPVSRLDESDAERALGAGEPGGYWVDTLFLERFESLWRANRARRTLGLLVHYLPSLVEHGDALELAQLSRAEAFALSHADAGLAPSAYMKSTLERLGFAKPERCLVVEPGSVIAGRIAEPATCDGVRALLIGAVTPGKGVEPFLRALGAELTGDDGFTLDIVGGMGADPSYAQSCRALVDASPRLRERVTFAGSLPPEHVVTKLASSNLLVSASRMESFGMALAEARTLGVPVAARRGGNSATLIGAGAGGALLESDRALACFCLNFARDRGAHRRAAELAWRHARPPRSFADAARDFVAQLSAVELADEP